MIELQTYICILLAISAFAMSFIVRVIIKQLQLYKTPISDPDVRHFRNILFLISMVIVVCGSIPIIINIYTLFEPSGRPPVVALVSFIYSLGVHLQTLLLSYLLWRIYRLANDSFNDKTK